MTEESIQKLLKYLASIGFNDPSLEQEIRTNIYSGVPEFNATQHILFGKELARFELQFQMDYQFDAYRLMQYKTTCQTEPGAWGSSRIFTPTATGTCHANLAFYIVSGKWNDLLEKFRALNLELFPGVEVSRSLERFLSRNQEQFEVKCSSNLPEGVIDYVIPVTKTDGWYSVDTYKATFTPHPPIEHGIFGGIDTQKLEDKMKKVRWDKFNEIATLHEDTGPEFIPPIPEIERQVYELMQAPYGAHVARQLQLRYWTNADYFSELIEHQTWQYFNSLPKREQYFRVELEAKLAFNLLCGRAVFQERVYPLPYDKPAWVRFDLTITAPNGGYLSEIIPGFDLAQLKAVLSTFPVTSDRLDQISRDLARGDITPLILPDGTQVLLETNPEQQTVNVYSTDMRIIPVNLRFDPDWKPAQNPELNPAELKRKPRQNIIHAEYPPDKDNRFQQRR